MTQHEFCVNMIYVCMLEIKLISIQRNKKSGLREMEHDFPLVRMAIFTNSSDEFHSLRQTDIYQ